MQLNRALANLIVDKAHAILKRDIALSNPLGELIADGNRGTIGQFVPDALRVAQTGQSAVGSFAGEPTKWWPFVYEEQTIGVFGLLLDAGPITQEAITLLQGLSEVLVYQHLLLDKLQSTERIRADFINGMLTASSIVSEDIYRQADILQLNLRTPQAVILADFGGLEAQLAELHRDLSVEEQRIELDAFVETIAARIRASFQNNSENIVSYIGNDRFVILKCIGGENLTTLNTIRFLHEKGEYIYETLQDLQRNYVISIGVGQYYPELAGLRKSYQDAKLALEVGKKVWGTGRVYHIKQVGMFVTLANTSQERKAELAYQILSPLLHEEQLYKTVQTFLANGLNLTDAADALHIHRNTLIYRLDKTKKSIGLDPRHFDDALQIKLGLMFYQDNSD